MIQPYQEGNPFPATWLCLEDTMLREISLKFWNKCCTYSLTCDSEPRDGEYGKWGDAAFICKMKI